MCAVTAAASKTTAVIITAYITAYSTSSTHEAQRSAPTELEDVGNQ